MIARTEQTEQRAEALAQLRQAKQTLAALSDHDAGGSIKTTPTLTREELLYREIGLRVRKERKELGFNQIELAEEVGFTRTSIVNIETGRQRPPIHVLYSIADALGVSIICLLPENMRGDA